jgi:putative PIN family toxin of toxin-antitoxin system
MEKSNFSIILDTNWYISYLIKKSDSSLSIILNDEQIKLIVSDKLITELRNKIHSKKFRKYFTTTEAEQFIELLKEVSVICNPSITIKISRDPKDNYLLALAKDAKADFLITGDKDLLVLNTFENTKIVTLNQFLKYIQ